MSTIATEKSLTQSDSIGIIDLSFDAARQLLIGVGLLIEECAKDWSSAMNFLQTLANPSEEREGHAIHTLVAKLKKLIRDRSGYQFTDSYIFAAITFAFQKNISALRADEKQHEYHKVAQILRVNDADVQLAFSTLMGCVLA